ncbi:MAG TPA: hypothetical protein VIH57_15135 [Bacteroidales bacterium]
MKGFFVLFMISLVACHSTRNISNFSWEAHQLTYDKVKVTISGSRTGTNVIKGYISMVKDSVICFKFYGPLSYPLFSGVYSSVFQLKDDYNNVRYGNAAEFIFQKFGFSIDRTSLEFLLEGKVEEFANRIKMLNTHNLKTEINNNTILFHIFETNGLLQFDFKFRKAMLSEIYVAYKDKLTQWTTDIDFLSVSNLSKTCNFRF